MVCLPMILLLLVPLLEASNPVAARFEERGHSVEQQARIIRNVLVHGKALVATEEDPK